MEWLDLSLNEIFPLRCLPSECPVYSKSQSHTYLIIEEVELTS
jgi:hypothetical protein